MALTPAQSTKVFEILDLPNKVNAFGVLRISHVVGPTGETFDLAAIQTEINSAITALTAAEEAEMTDASDGLLTEWDLVKNRHQRLFDDGGTKGIIFDADMGRERIRERMSNLLGVFVPKGGFMAEYRRILQRIMQHSAQSVVR